MRVEASLGGVDPGTPDVCFGWGGRNGWVELKVWPDPLSAEQFAWHAEALAKGSYAMVLCQLPPSHVWLGRFDIYMDEIEKWRNGNARRVVRPDGMHLHDALAMIESALSRR